MRMQVYSESKVFIRHFRPAVPWVETHTSSKCWRRLPGAVHYLEALLPTWLGSWTKHSKNPCLSSLLGHCAFWHVRNSEVSSFRLLDDKHTSWKELMSCFPAKKQAQVCSLYLRIIFSINKRQSVNYQPFGGPLGSLQTAKLPPP